MKSTLRLVDSSGSEIGSPELYGRAHLIIFLIVRSLRVLLKICVCCVYIARHGGLFDLSLHSHALSLLLSLLHTHSCRIRARWNRGSTWRELFTVPAHRDAGHSQLKDRFQLWRPGWPRMCALSCYCVFLLFGLVCWVSCWFTVYVYLCVGT